MKNNASSVGKKISAEKKTADDNNDDPFGALDWKDGIATLPGNVIKKEYLYLQLFHNRALDVR